MADALARVALTDTATVQAAAQAGRLYVPTRSLPKEYDVPRAFAPALTDTVLDLRDVYHGAADASTRAARKLDELASAWRSGIAGPAPGCLSPSSGPSGSARFLTRWSCSAPPRSITRPGT